MAPINGEGRLHTAAEMERYMPFEDKHLICRDCQKAFIFSAGEQEFFSVKGLANEPKRCANCRILMRVQRSGDPKQTAEVNCAQCGSSTRVPFQPKGYRPVYCVACFRLKKGTTEINTSDKATGMTIAIDNPSERFNSLDMMPIYVSQCYDSSPPLAIL